MSGNSCGDNSTHRPSFFNYSCEWQFDLIDSSENSNNSQLIKNDESFCALELRVYDFGLQMQHQLIVFYHLPTSRLMFFFPAER